MIKTFFYLIGVAFVVYCFYRMWKRKKEGKEKCK